MRLIQILSGSTLVLASLGCTAPPEEVAPPPEPEVVEVDEPKSDLSYSDCLDVGLYVDAIEYTFGAGESTAGEVMLLLDTSAEEFYRVADQHNGSERAWLEKMAELSLRLSIYLETGDGDGELVFDQLFNNFGLMEQFCD